MHGDTICSTYNEPVLPDEKGNCSLCGAVLVNVISTYTQQQAIEDGVLVEVFKDRWNQLTEGRPIVVTSHLYNEVSQAALLEIWIEFVTWREGIPHYPGEDEEENRHIFITEMNGKKVWLVWEIGQSFTMMYPEDY